MVLKDQENVSAQLDSWVEHVSYVNLGFMEKTVPNANVHNTAAVQTELVVMVNASVISHMKDMIAVWFVVYKNLRNIHRQKTLTSSFILF